jgi:hypothetical protein
VGQVVVVVVDHRLRPAPAPLGLGHLAEGHPGGTKVVVAIGRALSLGLLPSTLARAQRSRAISGKIQVNRQCHGRFHRVRNCAALGVPS